MDALVKKCSEVRKKILFDGKYHDNNVYVVLSGPNAKKVATPSGELFITILNKTRKAAGSVRRAEHPNIILKQSWQDVPQSVTDYVLWDHKALSENTALKTDKFTSLFDDVNVFDPFIQADGALINCYGPRQEQLDFDPDGHEKYHDAIKNSLDQIMRIKSEKFSDFQVLIRCVMYSQYCEHCLSYLLNTVDSLKNAQFLINCISQGVWSPMDRKKMEWRNWKDSNDCNYKISCWRMDPKAKLKIFPRPSAPSTSTNPPDNAVAEWHVELLHNVFEALCDYCDEIGGKTNLEKLEDENARMLGIKMLKLNLIRWLRELNQFEKTPDEVFGDFGFETGDSKIDEELEKLIKKLSDDRNVRLNWETIQKRMGADLFGRLNKLRKEDWEDEIMQKIEKKWSNAIVKLLTRPQTDAVEDYSMNISSSEDEGSMNCESDSDDSSGEERRKRMKRRMSTVEREDTPFPAPDEMSKEQKEKMFQSYREAAELAKNYNLPISSPDGENDLFCVYCGDFIDFSATQCSADTDEKRRVNCEVRRARVMDLNEGLTVDKEQAEAISTFCSSRSEYWEQLWKRHRSPSPEPAAPASPERPSFQGLLDDSPAPSPAPEPEEEPEEPPKRKRGRPRKNAAPKKTTTPRKPRVVKKTTSTRKPPAQKPPVQKKKPRKSMFVDSSSTEGSDAPDSDDTGDYTPDPPPKRKRAMAKRSKTPIEESEEEIMDFEEEEDDEEIAEILNPGPSTSSQKNDSQFSRCDPFAPSAPRNRDPDPIPQLEYNRPSTPTLRIRSPVEVTEERYPSYPNLQNYQSERSGSLTSPGWNAAAQNRRDARFRRPTPLRSPGYRSQSPEYRNDGLVVVEDYRQTPRAQGSSRPSSRHSVNDSRPPEYDDVEVVGHRRPMNQNPRDQGFRSSPYYGPSSSSRPSSRHSSYDSRAPAYRSDDFEVPDQRRQMNQNPGPSGHHGHGSEVPGFRNDGSEAFGDRYPMGQHPRALGFGDSSYRGPSRSAPRHSGYGSHAPEPRNDSVPQDRRHMTSGYGLPASGFGSLDFLEAQRRMNLPPPGSHNYDPPNLTPSLPRNYGTKTDYGQPTTYGAPSIPHSGFSGRDSFSPRDTPQFPFTAASNQGQAPEAVSTATQQVQNSEHQNLEASGRPTSPRPSGFGSQDMEISSGDDRQNPIDDSFQSLASPEYDPSSLQAREEAPEDTPMTPNPSRTRRSTISNCSWDQPAPSAAFNPYAKGDSGDREKEDSERIRRSGTMSPSAGDQEIQKTSTEVSRPSSRASRFGPPAATVRSDDPEHLEKMLRSSISRNPRNDVFRRSATPQSVAPGDDDPVFLEEKIASPHRKRSNSRARSRSRSSKSFSTPGQSKYTRDEDLEILEIRNPVRKSEKAKRTKTPEPSRYSGGSGYVPTTLSINLTTTLLEDEVKIREKISKKGLERFRRSKSPEVTPKVPPEVSKPAPSIQTPRLENPAKFRTPDASSSSSNTRYRASRSPVTSESDDDGPTPSVQGSPLTGFRISASTGSSTPLYERPKGNPFKPATSSFLGVMLARKEIGKPKISFDFAKSASSSARNSEDRDLGASERPTDENGIEILDSSSGKSASTSKSNTTVPPVTSSGKSLVAYEPSDDDASDDESKQRKKTNNNMPSCSSPYRPPTSNSFSSFPNLSQDTSFSFSAMDDEENEKKAESNGKFSQTLNPSKITSKPTPESQNPDDDDDEIQFLGTTKATKKLPKK